MNTGKAADILRTIQAGDKPPYELARQAIEAAPIGTTLQGWTSNWGNHVLVKLADGWGKREYVGNPPMDIPLKLRFPSSLIRWDSITLPPDAPTGDEETLIRDFFSYAKIPLSEEVLAAFLQSRKL